MSATRVQSPACRLAFSRSVAKERTCSVPRVRVGLAIALTVVVPSFLRAGEPGGDVTPQPISQQRRESESPLREKVANKLSLFASQEHRRGMIVLEINPHALDEFDEPGKKKFIVEQLTLSGIEPVDLELERFRVTSPRTQFVLGRSGGQDLPLTFDADRVVLLRGKVLSEPLSHVFLAISEYGITGRIELGPGKNSYVLTSVSGDGTKLPRGRLAVRRPRSTDERAGGSICEVAASDENGGENAQRAVLGGWPPDLVEIMRLVELAVETDYWYFELFGDLQEAAAYAVVLYGAVSDIYMRDVDVRFVLTYIRLWNLPGSGGLPLPSYVHRDVAQVLSGDPNMNGIGSIGLCGGGLSIAGSIRGTLMDPEVPSLYHRDLYVTAHELGHSCGSGHTHDYGIDQCDAGIPRRGTIMSYCSRPNGGLANYDMRIHSLVRLVMEDELQSAICVGFDCNLNGVDDDVDIESGTSTDVNANELPDECEDCNDNGILDDSDIESGTSQDLNSNDIPDECESDCNDNTIPDAKDIQDQTSSDENGNFIPDECEADCNGNGVADHVEINADMTLDIDRNAVLDECQDCNGDGITDRAHLAGAHNLWLYSDTLRAIGEYVASSGVEVRIEDDPLIFGGTDLVIGGVDGHILVATGLRDKVLEFDLEGAYLGEFVSFQSGGLDFAAAMVFDSAGHLYVSSRDTDSVLEYDTTGAFVGEFILPGAGNLSQPYGLTFGPNGNLFVASAGNNQIIEYDGLIGDFVQVFVAESSSGLDGPRGLTFKADGNLLVASENTDQVLEYDGRTGAYLGTFGEGAYLDNPWSLRVGPGGNLFVSHLEPSGYFCRINEVDIHNGHTVRHAFVCGWDLDIVEVTGFDFVPGWDMDCNFNAVPDECDIASEMSMDENADGVPDECQIDCNANGRYDRLDIIPFGISEDCNFNGVPDECEMELYDCNGNGVHDACDVRRDTSADCNRNSTPDECEPFQDCNDNQQNDICDISTGVGYDLNANWIPDECENRTIYVDDDAADDPGPGDPLVSDPDEDGSAEHPYDAIQEAISYALHGDEIIVADGTYTGLGNRNIDFDGKRVALRSANGAASCTIGAKGQGWGRIFSFHSGETPETVVQGFTITGGWAYSGGGLALWGDSSPTILECVISGNEAEGGDGGGIDCGYGCSPVISHCTITGNTATKWGGGIMCITNAHPIITHCVIAGNSAGLDGGGIMAWGGSPTITNCTISANSAACGGGIACAGTPSGSSPMISNSILWNNGAPTGPEMAVMLSPLGQPATLTVRYSDVENGQDGAYVESGCVLEWEQGNIDANPLLVGSDNDDYRLSAGSPCIDAASSAHVSQDEVDLDGDGDTTEPVPFDLGGNPRFVDDPERPDTGSGSCPIVDMGAYEYQKGHEMQCCPTDLNGDGEVGPFDLALLLNAWGPCADPEDCLADFDGDGAVGPSDLAVLLGNWGPCE